MLSRAVLVVPKGAEALVQPLVAALSAREGLRVHTHFGSLQDIVDSNDWREAELLAGAGVVCGSREMDLAPNLRAMIALTIGYDGFDVDAASTRGILVVNGQAPENYESMAEATILLILALLYDLHGAEARLRAGRWFDRHPRSRMAKGRVIGVIGFGNIARAIIDRLAGWGVSFLVHTRRPPASGYRDVEFVSLEEVVAGCDVLLPLTSLNESSALLLDAARLATMKEGAILVNTARGGLIDEDALVSMVAAGRIDRIALDVFQTEPLPLDSPLLALPGAVLTPHDLGHTRESSEGMFRLAMENISDVAALRIPQHAVNADAVPRWPTICRPL